MRGGVDEDVSKVDGGEMMNTKRYDCPNGCKLPKIRKTICSDKDDNYFWGYPNFPYCPKCGAFMPHTLAKIRAFFEINHIHPKLSKTVNLVYKSELQAAVREAAVVLENVLQKKSGLSHLYGKDLAAQALKFKYDQKSKTFIEPPLIAINKLDNSSRINEQEGLMYMIMGFFQGVRNIYQHKPVGTSGEMMLISILQVSYFLKLLDGHSITVNGYWIPTKISPMEIINKTPKLIDKIQIYRMYSKRYKKYRKNGK